MGEKKAAEVKERKRSKKVDPHGGRILKPERWKKFRTTSMEHACSN
jgi:hypothetical protein